MTVEVLIQLPDPIPETASLVLTRNPPEGYSYRLEYHKTKAASRSFLATLDTLVYSHERLKDALWLSRRRLPFARGSGQAKIVFSFLPFPDSTRLPLILHTEYAYPEAAAKSQLYRHLLTKSNIKKILAAGPTCARTFLGILSEGEFERLVGYVLPGIVPPQPFIKERREVTTLLFVASASGWATSDNWSADRSFNYRGGLDVLASFRELNKQFGSRVQLVIRSRIPDKAKELFADVLKLPNTKVYERVLGRNEFDMLRASSDIFMFPCYRGPSLSFAEAFSYYLPIVTADSWDNTDYVKNGVDGLVVHRDDSRYTLRNGIPFWDYGSISREPSDSEFVRSYTETIARLIEDKPLTLQLATNARRAVEHGRFALATMQARMAEIFQEVMGGI